MANRDLTRVSLNGEIFLPVSELAEMLDVSEQNLTANMHPKDMRMFGTQQLISEASYNDLLRANPDLFIRNGRHEEFTHISTLRAEVESARSLMPLKLMFLPNLDRQAEEERTIQEAMLKLSRESDGLSSYQEAIALLHNPQFIDIGKLHAADLDVQLCTEIANSGQSVGLIVFIVGTGFFYSLYLDEGSEEYWDDVKRLNDGAVEIKRLSNTYELESVAITPHTCMRDFRQYSVFENLAWCLQNLELQNEWRDEVNYSQDGIYFNLNLQTVVQMFNPYSFKESQLIAGLISVNNDVTEDMH